MISGLMANRGMKLYYLPLARVGRRLSEPPGSSLIKRGELTRALGATRALGGAAAGTLPSLQYPVNARPADAERLGDGRGQRPSAVICGDEVSTVPAGPTV